MPRSAPSALVLSLANVALVFVSDDSRLGDAGLALAHDDIAFSPIRPPGSDSYVALLCYFADVVPAGFAARAARLLHDDGFTAYGYELFHDHDITDADAFLRTFIGVAMLDEPGESFVSVVTVEGRTEPWVFGSPEGLDSAVEAAYCVGLPTDVVEGPDGPMTVKVLIENDDDLGMIPLWLDNFASIRIPPFAPTSG